MDRSPIDDRGSANQDRPDAALNAAGAARPGGRSRTARAAADFLRDERGSATLWNLFWLTGFGVLLGLGIDTTAAMNVKAKLQTIADSASHAAAMDLFPIADTAFATAVTYAEWNSPHHDGVVVSEDVVLGYWDRETRTFMTEDVPYLNAVRVFAARDSERENALSTFLLKLAGFDQWDIAAVSTASYFSDLSQTARCRSNGYLAGGEMEQTSNNYIVGQTCMHGETSLKINENNIITCGSQLSTPGQENWKTGTPPSGQPPEECDTNYGSLSNDEMIEQATVYTSSPSYAELEYQNVKEMLDAFVAGQPVNDPFNAIPPYIQRVQTVSRQTFNSLSKAPGGLLPGTLYVVTCNSNGGGGSLNPQGIIRNVGIYTDCRIDVAKDKNVSMMNPNKTTNNGTTDCNPDNSTCETVPWEAEYPFEYGCDAAIAAGFETYTTLLDTAPGETYRDGVTTDTQMQRCGIEPGATGVWDNVFVFTTAYEDGNNPGQNSISFPNNMQIGRLDNCEEGGGVRLYAGGSIATPSGAMIRGSHFIALGDLSLAAKASGVQGTTVEVAGNISFAAQGKVGGCPADVEYLASDVVITVRPVAIVN